MSRKTPSAAGTDADGGPAGGDNAIGDHDAEAALLEGDGIVTAVDMAVGDHHVFAGG